MRSAYNDLDVMLQITSPRTFILRDSPACTAGFAHLELADTRGNWCIIDIKDGPLINHPSVGASCSGINYLGTEYDGLNTYSSFESVATS